jgi:predicted transcriptional regulator
MNIIFAQCFASYAAGEVLSEGLAMMGLGEWIYKSRSILYNQPEMSENDTLRRWELRILSSIKKEAKSEKKIAKDISLNALITSQLITGLMAKDYIEKIISRGRIRRYSYTGKFAITQEGLAVLEESIRWSSPWNQLIEALRLESDGLPFKMTIGAARIAYRLAKFILIP